MKTDIDPKKIKINIKNVIIKLTLNNGKPTSTSTFTLTSSFTSTSSILILTYIP